MTKVLITGGCGFVGTHLIEHILKNTDWHIVSLDRFDASGNPNRLSDMLETTEGIERSRVKHVFWDLKAALNDQVINQLGGPFDYILHLAAGSHVDRSIDDPMGFFMDNCIGTINLLNYARNGGLNAEITVELPVEEGEERQRKLEDIEENLGVIIKVKGAYAQVLPYQKHGLLKSNSKFLYFSTDEVYGPAPFDSEEGFKEWARLNPNNPYAAAKAAAEMAVISFANTYKIPCIITNTMNIFGERQNPEKFIPLIINKVLKGEKLLIHANKDKTQAGKRHYLHARNICAATLWAVQNGKTLDGSGSEGRYNVVGEKELDNEQMAKLVTEYVNEWIRENRPNDPTVALNYELVDFHSSRPGHDLRYALDGTKLREEGFAYPASFEESLKKMVFWTLEHKDKWLV